MGLEQITEFKQFLFDNFSNVGIIAILTTVFLIVFSFALREILSWFVKTDKLRREVKSLKHDIRNLRGDVRTLSEKLSNQSSVNHAEPGPSRNEKTSAFPFSH